MDEKYENVFEVKEILFFKGNMIILSCFENKKTKELLKARKMKFSFKNN